MDVTESGDENELFLGGCDRLCGFKRRRFTTLASHPIQGEQNNNVLKENSAYCTPNNVLPLHSKHFLCLQNTLDGVYRTEDVKGPGEGDTLYLPLDCDTYVNLTRVDEVTFRQGIFFVGDSSGRYIKSVQGSALFQW